MDERVELAVLQGEFPGHRIWRTRNGVELAWWAATRRDPAAGVSATVMAKTPVQLRVQLAAERQAAADGVQPYDVAKGDITYGEIGDDGAASA